MPLFSGRVTVVVKKPGQAPADKKTPPTPKSDQFHRHTAKSGSDARDIPITRGKDLTLGEETPATKPPSVAQAKPPATAAKTEKPKHSSPVAPQPTEKAPSAEKTSAEEPAHPKTLTDKLKSWGLSAVSLLLFITPAFLPFKATFLGLVTYLAMTAPFILAKDMVEDYAKHNKIKDYSNIHTMRKVLDGHLEKRVDQFLGFLPEAIRKPVVKKVLGVYQRAANGLTQRVQAKVDFPELKALPQKLKGAKTQSEKLGLAAEVFQKSLGRFFKANAERIFLSMSRRNWLFGLVFGGCSTVFGLFGLFKDKKKPQS